MDGDIVKGCRSGLKAVPTCAEKRGGKPMSKGKNQRLWEKKK